MGSRVVSFYCLLCKESVLWRELRRVERVTLFPLDIALLNEAIGFLSNVLVEEVGVLSDHSFHAVIEHDRSSIEVAMCLFDSCCCPDSTDGVRMRVLASITVDDP